VNWILCDIPAGNNCTMIMNEDKNLIAEFSSCMFPSRITGSPFIYNDYLQNAADGVNTGDILQSRNYIFTENVTFHNAAAITLEAGYDCTYSAVTGTTTISGNMIIQNGSITIQKGTLMIQ
jgi:hypothetical protein